MTGEGGERGEEGRRGTGDRWVRGESRTVSCLNWYKLREKFFGVSRG